MYLWDKIEIERISWKRKTLMLLRPRFDKTNIRKIRPALNIISQMVLSLCQGHRVISCTLFTSMLYGLWRFWFIQTYLRSTACFSTHVESSMFFINWTSNQFSHWPKYIFHVIAGFTLDELLWSVKWVFFKAYYHGPVLWFDVTKM